jgi:hypothetical protein
VGCCKRAVAAALWIRYLKAEGQLGRRKLNLFSTPHLPSPNPCTPSLLTATTHILAPHDAALFPFAQSSSLMLRKHNKLVCCGRTTRLPDTTLYA